MKRYSFSAGFSLLECLVATLIFGILSTMMLGYIQVSELQFSESINEYLAYLVAQNQLQVWTEQGYANVTAFCPVDSCGSFPGAYLNDPCDQTLGPCGVGTASYNTTNALSDIGAPFQTKFTFRDGYLNITGLNNVVELVVSVTWQQQKAIGGTWNKTITLSGYVAQ